MTAHLEELLQTMGLDCLAIKLTQWSSYGNNISNVHLSKGVQFPLTSRTTFRKGRLNGVRMVTTLVMLTSPQDVTNDVTYVQNGQST